MKVTIHFLEKQTELDLASHIDVLNLITSIKEDKYNSLSKLIQPFEVTARVGKKAIFTSIDFNLIVDVTKASFGYDIIVNVDKVTSTLGNTTQHIVIDKQEFSRVNVAYKTLCDDLAATAPTAEVREAYIKLRGNLTKTNKESNNVFKTNIFNYGQTVLRLFDVFLLKLKVIKF